MYSCRNVWYAMAVEEKRIYRIQGAITAFVPGGSSRDILIVAGNGLSNIDDDTVRFIRGGSVRILGKRSARRLRDATFSGQNTNAEHPHTRKKKTLQRRKMFANTREKNTKIVISVCVPSVVCAPYDV